MPTLWGVSSTGRWQDDARPKDWRDAILKWYYNGDVPLTAMTAKMKTKVATDPEIKWWVQDPTTQYCTITGMYVNATLSTALTSQSKGSGSPLWAKMSAAHVADLRPGHMVRITRSGYSRYSKVAMVSNVATNGDNSYVAIITKEADAVVDGSSLANSDRMLVITNINSENSAAPQSIFYEPTQFYNYTQIFRTSLRLSGTAMATDTRYGTSEYQREKVDALERHSIEMEKAFHFGIKFEEIAPDGNKRRSTQGIVAYAKEFAPAENISSFKIDYPGQTWANKGKKWLNDMLKRIYSRGSNERFCFCGSGALGGVSELAEIYGTVNLQVGANSYGMKVSEWLTNHGSLTFKSHPLYNIDDDLQYAAVIFNPSKITYRPLKGRDTKFLPAKDPGNQSETQVDGITEGWLTEAALELGIGAEYAVLYDIGRDG